MSETLEKIQSLAKAGRSIRIIYQKAALDPSPPPRLIEPCSITQGKQDVMVRAYQIEPDEGWRMFMLHKIISVADSGQNFRTREKVSRSFGVIQKVYEPYESWTPELCEYRAMVLGTLSDMKISREETQQLAEYRTRHKLTEAQVRSVHGSIFSNCLIHVLTDGLIDDSEREQISAVHKCLAKAGAGII